MRVIVIGGMNLDLLGMVDTPLTARDSNPGRVISRPGGVGRNIAARLCGEQVPLLQGIHPEGFSRRYYIER